MCTRIRTRTRTRTLLQLKESERARERERERERARADRTVPTHSRCVNGGADQFVGGWVGGCRWIHYPVRQVFNADDDEKL
jgi:hypothetical protein